MGVKQCSTCEYFYRKSADSSLCVRTQIATRAIEIGTCNRHTAKATICKYCTSSGYKIEYMDGIVVGVNQCIRCNFDGSKEPSAELIAAFPLLFNSEPKQSEAVTCGACDYYNPHIGKCLNNKVNKQIRVAHDWCSKYKPKQEEKQMKNLITEIVEVNLGGTWTEIKVMFEDENFVYFYDPRPMPAPPAPMTPQPITQVTFSRVNKAHKETYRITKYVYVVVDKEFNVVHCLDKDAPVTNTMQNGHRLGKLILE